MKSVCAIALLAWSCLRAQATITLNIDALDLRSGPSGGSALVPTTGLFLLVASTTDGVFGGPTATSFSSGSDDVILFHGVSGSGSAGWFDQRVNFQPSGNLSAGDPLRLYWFPTL